MTKLLPLVALAGALTASGIGIGARIAQLMYNCPEYLESTYAAFKARATPVNVNYRYKAPEIAYICDNAGAEVLVFHGSLGQQVAELQAELDQLESFGIVHRQDGAGDHNQQMIPVIDTDHQQLGIENKHERQDRRADIVDKALDTGFDRIST